MADQAEVRRRHQLGRPHDPHGQRRPRESWASRPSASAGGRADVWEPEEDVYWGPEAEWLADKRYTGDRELENPLAAVQMGLIYVNPEGPNGNPDPLAAAHDIRETFGRMAMNDEETVALIAGGHTFGKAHGAADPGEHVGRRARRRQHRRAGHGLEEHLRHRAGPATPSPAASRASGRRTPTEWDNGYFENLFGYEWELTKSPAGAQQWVPVDGGVPARCRTRTIQCQDPPADHADDRPQPCASTRPTRRSRAASTRTRTSSPTPSPAPGTS